MNYVFRSLCLGLLTIISIVLVLFYLNHKKEINSFSAYYNVEGAFAGFIQKKNNLIRACEFSTNGSILSCSKWFDDNALQQGLNQGLSEKNI